MDLEELLTEVSLVYLMVMVWDGCRSFTFFFFFCFHSLKTSFFFLPFLKGGKSAALYVQANMHKVLVEQLNLLGDAAQQGDPAVIGDLFKRVYKVTGMQGEQVANCF